MPTTFLPGPSIFAYKQNIVYLVSVLFCSRTISDQGHRAKKNNTIIYSGHLHKKFRAWRNITLIINSGHLYTICRVRPKKTNPIIDSAHLYKIFRGYTTVRISSKILLLSNFRNKQGKPSVCSPHMNMKNMYHSFVANISLNICTVTWPWCPRRLDISSFQSNKPSNTNFYSIVD